MRLQYSGLELTVVDLVGDVRVVLHPPKVLHKLQLLQFVVDMSVNLFQEILKVDVMIGRRPS